MHPRNIFRLIDIQTDDHKKCWEWKGPLSGSDKRPYVSINGRKVLAYRVAYEIMFGVTIGDKYYLHQCDNKICCNPWHGKLGTHQENMDEMKERERHGLPHHTIRAIRKVIATETANGLSNTLIDVAVSDRFGITESNARAIREGRSYQHVKDEEDEHTRED